VKDRGNSEQKTDLPQLRQKNGSAIHCVETLQMRDQLEEGHRIL
jgi:hypothetical protein